MTSAPIKPLTAGSLSGLEKLRLETPSYRPRGTNRYDGPALPPGGRPDTLPGLERLNERLERLAFGRPSGTSDGRPTPPLVTYTTTPGPYGDVVSATDDYIRWFRSCYPNAGGEDPVRISRALPSTEEVGRAQGRWKQNDLAP